MKNAKRLLLMITVALICSCSGTPEGGDNIDDGEITSLTLVPDKTTLEADGKDVVRFTVMTNTGKDISDTPGVRVQNKTTNVFLDGMEFSASENGTSNFAARYNGIWSEEVEITAKNRSAYEKYYRNVALFQITGTWCVNCPGMTAAFKAIDKMMPGRTQVLAFHASSSSGTDPFHATETIDLLRIFNINGFPSAIVDMRTVTSASTSLLVEQISKSLDEYPAAVGIKINSKFNASTRTADIDVSVAADKAGKYSVAYAVVVDGLKAPQEGADSDYVHNNVVIGVNNVMGGLIGNLAAGGEWKSSAGNFSTVIPQGYDMNNVRVVVYVLKEETDGNWYVNNIASCSANNGSVDYKLNE